MRGVRLSAASYRHVAGSHGRALRKRRGNPEDLSRKTRRARVPAAQGTRRLPQQPHPPCLRQKSRSAYSCRLMWQLARPRFSRYCWWYSSARQKVCAGSMAVAMGRRNLPDSSKAFLDLSAAAFCSGVW
jgi:hypothetical protein